MKWEWRRCWFEMRDESLTREWSSHHQRRCQRSPQPRLVEQRELGNHLLDLVAFADLEEPCLEEDLAVVACCRRSPERTAAAGWDRIGTPSRLK